MYAVDNKYAFKCKIILQLMNSFVCLDLPYSLFYPSRCSYCSFALSNLLPQLLYLSLQ